jgi:hypothetical protein
VVAGKTYAMPPAKTIMVHGNEDLRNLAKYHCGSGRRWKKLAEYNGLSTENPVLNNPMNVDLAIPPKEYFGKTRFGRLKDRFSFSIEIHGEGTNSGGLNLR